MKRINGIWSQRLTPRGLIAALFVAAVLLAGTFAAPSSSEASGGSISPWISAYYNSYDMRVYVYGGGFTPGSPVEVDIVVDSTFVAWQITTANPYGEIYVYFGPYCPQHVSLKAVDKTGRGAGFTFTTYACPW
jgi:hypothetical protein